MSGKELLEKLRHSEILKPLTDDPKELQWYANIMEKFGIEISQIEADVFEYFWFDHFAENRKFLFEYAFYNYLFRLAVSPIPLGSYYYPINPYLDKVTVGGNDSSFISEFVEHIIENKLSFEDISRIIDEMFSDEITEFVFNELINLNKEELKETLIDEIRYKARRKIAGV